jgi:hypothetical protein
MEHSKIVEILEVLSEQGSQLTNALEAGKIIFLPKHGFELNSSETSLLNERILAPRKKNISFDVSSAKINHIAASYQKTPMFDLVSTMMQRFAEYSRRLVIDLFPTYEASLVWGRTSYRPIEITNRRVSRLKNDKLLHVDAFKSMPVKGYRILRVFSNINPQQKPRVWNIGEEFNEVLNHFDKKIKPYSNVQANLLAFLKLTKSKRTAYDHFMLQLHDQMKLDEAYQNKAKKVTWAFPAQSSWIVFTDQVSHAALSGQYLLEQTFYLPVSAMLNAKTAPLAHWQRLRPHQATSSHSW